MTDGWGEGFKLCEAHYTGSNGTPRHRFGPSLNRDAWDKLDQDQKEIILKSRKPNTSTPTAAPPASPAPSAVRQIAPAQERQVNFTDASDEPPMPRPMKSVKTRPTLIPSASTTRSRSSMPSSYPRSQPTNLTSCPRMTYAASSHSHQGRRRNCQGPRHLGRPNRPNRRKTWNPKRTW